MEHRTVNGREADLQRPVQQTLTLSLSAWPCVPLEGAVDIQTITSASIVILLRFYSLNVEVCSYDARLVLGWPLLPNR